MIENSKVGVRKPDPRIYLMMCETLGLAPAECTYLDDLGINRKPAAAEALADLGALLGIDFGAA